MYLDFGGEFIACKTCLSRAHIIQPNSKVPICICPTSSGNFLAYNYAVSVHNPAMVKFYVEYCKPVFEKMFGTSLPHALAKYYAIHSQ